jgi:hypothetical protein
VQPGQSAIEGGLVKTIALHHFSGGSRRAEPVRLPRETPDSSAARFESSKEAAADVSGSAGKQDCRRHSTALVTS